MAETAVMTDPVTDAVEQLKRLTKVMTTKAAIAQTPKELVWTLNKAKLYRYVPVVPKEKRHPVPLLLVFALMNRPYILDLAAGPQLCGVHGQPGLRSVPARLGSARSGRQEPEV